VATSQSRSFLEKAAEIRRIATHALDPDLTDELLTLARRFERLALYADEMPLDQSSIGNGTADRSSGKVRADQSRGAELMADEFDAAAALVLISARPGISDREIAEAAYGSGTPGYAVNAICRQLAADGHTQRRLRGDGLLGNYPLPQQGERQQTPGDDAPGTRRLTG
jgi:hypothetical protein